MKLRFYQNKEWLRKRFVLDKKTPQEIADECGVSMMTVYRYLKEFNLIRK